MFNRKKNQIKELEFLLLIYDETADYWLTVAQEKIDLIDDLEMDVVNLTAERDQWKKGYLRWSERYDQLAALDPGLARLAAAKESWEDDREGPTCVPEGLALGAPFPYPFKKMDIGSDLSKCTPPNEEDPDWDLPPL